MGGVERKGIRKLVGTRGGGGGQGETCSGQGGESLFSASEKPRKLRDQGLGEKKGAEAERGVWGDLLGEGRWGRGG